MGWPKSWCVSPGTLRSLLPDEGEERKRAMGTTPTSGTRDRLIERLRRQAVAMQNGYRREDALLTTGEVAMLFRVSHRAVRCWADAGKLPYIRTLGGHRRFMSSAVWEALREVAPDVASPERPVAQVWRIG
jgi:excisionase family DNA binding protein